MQGRITGKHAPAPGDIRTMGAGDVLWIHADAGEHHNWGALVSAIGTALVRGVEIRRKWDD